MRLRYQSFVPPPALRATVEALWTLDSPEPVKTRITNRVLPDGCMDIILNPGDPGIDTSGAVANPHASFAVGTMTTALDAGLRGSVRLVGARFRPGAVSAFLAPPAAEFTDTLVALDALWGTEVRGLEEAAAAAAGPAARAGVLARALVCRLPGDWRPDPLVAAALEAIQSSGGTAAMRHVASAAGAGPRRLQRAFHAAVGVAPKVAARVERFRHATALAAARPDLSWGAVAAACGYADQPHLVREFGRLAGMTPGAWREVGGPA